MITAAHLAYKVDLLSTGPDYIRFVIFVLAHSVPSFEHLKIKHDINQQHLKIVNILSYIYI